jgi:hypothetical protein
LLLEGAGPCAATELPQSTVFCEAKNAPKFLKNIRIDTLPVVMAAGSKSRMIPV